MKKMLLMLPVVLLLFSCTGVYSPAIDTTPPEILSVYTSPSTVVAGQGFTLIADVYDAESVVTVTYDMDNNGIFDDNNWGVFPTSGTKTIAVRAESAGGVTVSFYYLSVTSISLELFLTFSASTNILNGDFLINYTIKNFSNVPIYLTGNSYVIYDSNHTPIPAAEIGIDYNSLTYNTYLAVNASRAEVLDGYSMYLIPGFYDLTVFFNDGQGSSATEVYLGGAFTLQ